MDSQTAILIGSAAATCGWIYSNRRARMLSRKQHTINVMLQASLNKDYKEALEQISKAKKIGNCPNLEMEENASLQSALKTTSNHLEFISAGLRNGDFDERLVRDSLRSTFVEIFEFYERHITTMRDSRKRRSMYEHFEWLIVRWTTHRPNFIQRILESVIGRPFQGRRVKN